MRNRIFKRVLTFFCASVILFAAFLGVTVSADTVDTQNESDVYYCREALKSLQNADSLLFAYDQLVAGVEASLDKITLHDAQHEITSRELEIVYDAYTRDHTEHFWLGKQYTFSHMSNSDAVREIRPQYTISGSELLSARETYERAMSQFLSLVNDGMTDYEKELVFHDALASKVVYEESNHAHDSYGAIVEGVAVCEGYAKALQCLLHKVGIRSLIATGSSINPSTQQSEGHAWNIVRLGGKYYHTDLTWDDQSTVTFHAYLNVTDTVIGEDHQLNRPAFALPTCYSYDANYFVESGAFMDVYTVATVSQLLIRDSLITSVYIPGDVDEFITWFRDHVREIVTEIGITDSCTYGYKKLGHEVVLQIDACLHQELRHVPEKPVTCTEDGNEEYYVCDCGRYFKDSEAKVTVIAPTTLFLTAPGHNFVNSAETEEFLKDTPENCLSAYTYWKSCAACGLVSDTEYHQSQNVGIHTPGAEATVEAPQTCVLCSKILAPQLHSHTAVLVAETAPTCSKEGKKAYYTCECGENFLDAEATKKLTNIDYYGKIDALGHGKTLTNGRCERCGVLMEVFNIYTVGIGVAVIAFLIIIKILSFVTGRQSQRD